MCPICGVDIVNLTWQLINEHYCSSTEAWEAHDMNNKTREQLLNLALRNDLRAKKLLKRLYSQARRFPNDTGRRWESNPTAKKAVTRGGI
jgi:hypothetical protein